MFEALRERFLGLGSEYGVNPLVFGLIYVGAIPFFAASVAWLLRNLQRGRSIVVPVLCASLCLVSAYLYLAIAGRDIPVWVYVFVASLLALSGVSTIRKIRAKLRATRGEAGTTKAAAQ